MSIIELRRNRVTLMSGFNYIEASTIQVSSHGSMPLKVLEVDEVDVLSGSMPLKAYNVAPWQQPYNTFSILKRIDALQTPELSFLQNIFECFQYPQTDRYACNIHTLLSAYVREGPFSILVRIDLPVT